MKKNDALSEKMGIEFPSENKYPNVRFKIIWISIPFNFPYSFRTIKIV